MELGGVAWEIVRALIFQIKAIKMSQRQSACGGQLTASQASTGKQRQISFAGGWVYTR